MEISPHRSMTSLESASALRTNLLPRFYIMIFYFTLSQS